ncbi:MAG: PAS domain-containing protein [Thiobacillus sp.]|nr:PAS domain-containing protein [Thiobacillus sp.]
MHRLLERQIKRTLGISPERWPELENLVRVVAHQAGEGDAELARALLGLPELLQRVSEAYAQQDRDLALLRRSLEVSSEELSTANQRLREDAKASAKALKALQQAFDATRGNPAAADKDENDLVSMAEQLADLTREQERMRQALTKSEERFELAMRGANDGLWDYDLVNGSVYYSPRWKEMVGEDEHDVGSAPEEWRNRVHPQDLHNSMSALEAHLSGHTPHYEGTFRFRHRKGHYIWILARGLAIRNPEGRAVRLVGTHSDITKRMELERYLGQFKAAIDEHAIVSITDVEGRITYANRKFCEISGYRQEELLGQNHRIVKSGMHPDGYYADMWATISSGHTWTGEICNRARDGRLYWVLATLAPLLDDNGLPYQYIGIRADITERKLHEEELRLAKEGAEAASKAKSEFLANMSHEIRTPMNGVLGMINLTLDTPLDAEQREYLGLAHSSANALLHILNDILDFSKIEAGRLDVHQELMSPLDLAGELARLHEPRCREKGLEFQLKTSTGLPSTLVADLARVRQVLVNLLSNAIKFTSQGRITLEISRAQDDICFHVRDTGIGIPKDKQASVFEAFTQADGSITKRFGGTGLGLTISNRLVQLMGGHMGLRSEAGVGSEFYFCLPLRAHSALPATSPVTQAAPACENARALRILLAEDNAINQKLALALLGKAGHQVTVVEDGAAAVGSVMSEPFDLVLMDMQMPGMDGLEATRRIRHLPAPSGQVPIIALTANAYPDDEARCLEAGMDGYVAKPIRRDVLMAAIEEALYKV